ncbi:MAG: type II secretion system F family protein [Aeromicrobium sp.]
MGIVLIAGAIGALTVGTGLVALPDKTIRARLLPTEVPGADDPGAQRMRQVDRLEGAERYVMPGGLFGRIERNLVLAGHPAPWSTRNIALVKVVLPVAMFLAVSSFVLDRGSPIMTGMGLAAVVVAYFVPDLLIYSRATERQEQLQRDLPDVLDKIVISVEAGLGFEAAMAATARSGTGPLAEELVRTTQDIGLGMARRDAYQALQKRSKSEDLTSFVRGVIQAEEHGSSMSSMVRIQSKEMRMKRKLRAEGKAGKVSVKLLGPLMACIFPVLFIVVLAPGILNAVAMF